MLLACFLSVFSRVGRWERVLSYHFDEIHNESSFWSLLDQILSLVKYFFFPLTHFLIEHKFFCCCFWWAVSDLWIFMMLILRARSLCLNILSIFLDLQLAMKKSAFDKQFYWNTLKKKSRDMFWQLYSCTIIWKIFPSFIHSSHIGLGSI